jgi:protoheme IX farnesyltransferase
MLPAVFAKPVAARIIFLHTVALVLVSVLPFFYGLGWIYLVGALAGGLYFLKKSYDLVRRPSVATARANFKASLVQLTLLLCACVLDVVFV